MTQDSAPAGWYDDPAGGGGRRYWNGRAWTERTQGAAQDVVQPRSASSSRRDRVPEGHMMLNGRQVPLGQTTTPSAQRASTTGDSRNRGVVVAAAVTLGIVLLIVVSSLFATDDELDLGGAWTEEGEYAALYTIEVDSRAGTGVDVIWSDGTDEYAETAVDPGWSTDIGATNGEIWMEATANDGRDVPTCRVVDADGSVLMEATASGPGETASCSWED